MTEDIWLFPQSCDARNGGFKNVEDLRQFMEVELLAPDSRKRRFCYSQVRKPKTIVYSFNDRIYGHLEVAGWEDPQDTDKFGEDKTLGDRVYLISEVVPYSIPVDALPLKDLPNFNTVGTKIPRAVFEKLKSDGKALPAISSVAPVTDCDYEKFDRVRRRLRQSRFRADLNDAYDGRCAVTSCAVAVALEAAHIRPYCEGGMSTVANGILLRADLHGLFDEGLIAFEPTTGRISISAELASTEYARYEGKMIYRPIDKARWPDTEALRYRWESRIP